MRIAFWKNVYSARLKAFKVRISFQLIFAWNDSENRFAANPQKYMRQDIRSSRQMVGAGFRKTETLDAGDIELDFDDGMLFHGTTFIT